MPSEKEGMESYDAGALHRSSIGAESGSRY